MTMLDAVYVDAKNTKSIVAIKPKPPFMPIFQVAATKSGSKIHIVTSPSRLRLEARPCFWWRRERAPSPPAQRYIGMWFIVITRIIVYRTMNNITLAIAGIVLLGLGIALKVFAKRSGITRTMNTAGILLIALGALLLIYFIVIVLEFIFIP